MRRAACVFIVLTLSSAMAGDSFSIKRNRSLKLILLGRAGSGKSSTGNTILNRDVFTVRHTFGSKGTRGVQKGSSDDLKVAIVDTPGLFDTERTEEDTALSLVEAVASLPPGPQAVLFVIKIGRRFTKEEFSVFEQVKALFDKDITKHTIIVFTGGDHLQRERIAIEDILKNAPCDLQKILEECENRYVVFDNKSKAKESQVQELFVQVDRLKARHHGEPFTSPYAENVGNERIKDWIANRLKLYHLSELRVDE